MAKKTKNYFQKELERIYSEHSLRPEQYAQVRKSKVDMEKYYSNKIQLNDLADAAFMSRFHYVRVFQRMYGLTPIAYLRDLRIAEAKKLISSGLPITQVCFDVGYQSISTFSSVFKKCVGHTPREYQRLHSVKFDTWLFEMMYKWA